MCDFVVASEIVRPVLSAVRDVYGVRTVAAVLSDSGLVFVQIMPDGDFIVLC